MSIRIGLRGWRIVVAVVMIGGARVIAAGNPAPAAAEAAEVVAAQALQDAHKLDESRAAWERIAARWPRNVAANCALTIIALNQGKWERALELAERAVTAEPQNARCQYAWGAANGLAALKSGVFSKLGHARKCLASYRRAAELEPTNPLYHWTLLNYYQQAPGFAGGSMELAFAQAAELTKLDPAAGRRARVQLLLGQKKYAEAFQEFDGVWREESADGSVHYDFGRLTLMSGQRLDDGLVAFRRCLALVPPGDSAPHARADLHWRIGSVCEKKGDPAKAREEYLAALQEQPDFGPAKQALEKLGQSTATDRAAGS